MIIGVGGNGVHSLLAYIHLSRLLNEPVPKPLANPEGGELLVIDADTSSDDPNSLWKRFVDEYQSENMEFQPKLYLMDPNPVSLSKYKKGTFPFRQFMNNVDFLKFLFEESHLDQDILYGFVGKPPIGASVFYRKIREDIVGETPEGAEVEDQFKNVLNTKRKDRVIFTGSFIGGTGAGVIPALSKVMKDKNEDFEIIYIAHSNWFSLEGSSPNALYNVTQDDISKNVVGGMSFLVKNMEIFKTIVVIDYKNPIRRKNDSGKEQKENRDFFYLLAAFLIRGYRRVKKLKDGIFSINLSFSDEPDINDSLFHRFSVKDEYDNQDDMFPENRKVLPPFSLFDRIKKAYNVYFYTTYFLKWLDTPGFRGWGNPMSRTCKNLIIKNAEAVRNRLQQEKLRLKRSIDWLESLRIPEDLKDLFILPYSISDFPVSDDLSRILSFFENNNINIEEVNRNIDIPRRENVPNYLIKEIWRLL